MKKSIEHIIFIFNLWGTPNWYKGIDTPTFWQWVYKWRISLKTAIEISNILY